MTKIIFEGTCWISVWETGSRMLQTDRDTWMALQEFSKVSQQIRKMTYTGNNKWVPDLEKKLNTCCAGEISMQQLQDQQKKVQQWTALLEL